MKGLKKVAIALVLILGLGVALLAGISSSGGLGGLFAKLFGVSSEYAELEALAKQFLTFVDEAGKEAPARRARARIVLSFAVEFYRAVARELVGGPTTNDAEVHEFVCRACRTWVGGVDRAVECTERTLAALGHLDRYANQATLIEGWLDDLAALAHV